MVDRAARDEYAEILRHFASGTLDRHVYLSESARITRLTTDRGVRAVAEHIWWVEPEIDREHGAMRRMASDERRCLSRLLLFLYSDLEYAWHDSYSKREEVVGSIVLALGSLVFMPCLRLGWEPYLIAQSTLFGLLWIWQGQKLRRYLASEDIGIWPFLHQEDMAEARRHPRLLAGRG